MTDTVFPFLLETETAYHSFVFSGSWKQKRLDLWNHLCGSFNTRAQLAPVEGVLSQFVSLSDPSTGTASTEMLALIFFRQYRKRPDTRLNQSAGPPRSAQIIETIFVN